MDNFETKLIENFNEKDLANHPIDWVAEFRSNAINSMETLGVPKVSDEDWRFTSLKNFVSKEFSPIPLNKPKVKLPKLPKLPFLRLNSF